ncbi:hypothetical protein NDS46_22435 [Paenibacillus thiaminolyticus]|uniref:hypothetical protein n=1 Tax=Paenibacillus thiaminolyticus TaxID=49283 RepID=UPI00232FFAE7|nr:hypothetical protein [Paenibacillus thiaminolyticus]WCF07067.1 hypothetical protein NDS46_22435 [Paenibacillus thiaminolyticus]
MVDRRLEQEAVSDLLDSFQLEVFAVAKLLQGPVGCYDVLRVYQIDAFGSDGLIRLELHILFGCVGWPSDKKIDGK